MGCSDESSGLVICDIEILRPHYAKTMALWHQRFHSHCAKVAQRMGERFCRMWEFYLASCEAAFRWRDLVVFQLQLTHRLDAAPITRAYLYRAGDKTGVPASEAVRAWQED